jgi:selenocysteine lyase/cysteine desulfurase
MSDPDTQTKMARLQMAFPSNDVLGDQLGIDRSTVAKIANGSAPGERHPDVVDAVDDLYEQVQNEHTAALSMDATIQQAMTEFRKVIREFRDAESQCGRHEAIQELKETIDRTERVLDKQRDRICA